MREISFICLLCQFIDRKAQRNDISSSRSKYKMDAHYCSSSGVCIYINGANVNVNYYCSSSSSEVRSMIMWECAPKSWLSSEVRSITTGGFRAAAAAMAQMWFLKTLRVITNPQWHFAKSRLNSASESPGRVQESSRRSRSNAVSGRMTGRSKVTMDAKSLAERSVPIVRQIGKQAKCSNKLLLTISHPKCNWEYICGAAIFFGCGIGSNCWGGYKQL